MKAALNLDQDADTSTLPEAYRKLIKFEKRAGTLLVNGEEVPNVVAYFPKGTVFEGQHAIQLCRTGQASPIDEECAAAVGMTPEQLGTKFRTYLAASRGIKGKKDLEMFMAGAIEGYAEGSTDDAPRYIPGPNWEAWQEALQTEKAKAIADVI